MPSTATAATPGSNDTTSSGLVGVEVDGAADRLPIVQRGQPVHHLERRVLDHVGQDLGRDLLDDDHPLAVGTDLGEQ